MQSNARPCWLLGPCLVHAPRGGAPQPGKWLKGGREGRAGKPKIMRKRQKTGSGETTVLALHEITDLVATALTRNGLNADSAAAIAEVSGFALLHDSPVLRI